MVVQPVFMYIYKTEIWIKIWMRQKHMKPKQNEKKYRPLDRLLHWKEIQQHPTPLRG